MKFRKKLQPYSGLDGYQTLQIILPDVDATERHSILEAQNKTYEGKYLYGVRPFTGVRDVFASLTPRSGRIALATDCKGRALKHHLSILEVDDLVSAMACGDDVEHGKPDPRVVGFALRKLGLPTSETVLIDDTPCDAEAGLEAGTSAGVVLRGGFSREVLRAAGCFAVAEDLLGLLPNLKTGRPSTLPNAAEAQQSPNFKRASR